MNIQQSRARNKRANVIYATHCDKHVQVMNKINVKLNKLHKYNKKVKYRN